MLNLNLTERHLLTIMRKEKGIRQPEIAKAIGVHQPVISDFETGKIKLTSERYNGYKDFIINYDPKVKVSESQRDKVAL